MKNLAPTSYSLTFALTTSEHYSDGYLENQLWIPHSNGGVDELSYEGGFLYWLFQTFSIPPFFLILVVAFSIVACTRVNVCTCCNRGNRFGAQSNVITVQA